MAKSVKVSYKLAFLLSSGSQLWQKCRKINITRGTFKASGCLGPTLGNEIRISEARCWNLVKNHRCSRCTEVSFRKFLDFLLRIRVRDQLCNLTQQVYPSVHIKKPYSYHHHHHHHGSQLGNTVLCQVVYTLHISSSSQQLFRGDITVFILELLKLKYRKITR